MKTNTSGYHHQTHGLVKKFNLNIQSMIAKSSDGDVMKWNNCLSAYRSVVKSLRRKFPCSYCTVEIPTCQLEQSSIYTVDLDDYRTELGASYQSKQSKRVRVEEYKGSIREAMKTL